jgi:hypothetical protein
VVRQPLAELPRRCRRQTCQQLVQILPRLDNQPLARGREAERAALPLVPLSFQSIDDVPESLLCEVVCERLRTIGATQEGELIQDVARQLGFKRTGNRIQARIEGSLESLIRAGKIARAADQRLQAAPAARAAGA